jgi:hypothetical protein
MECQTSGKRVDFTGKNIDLCRCRVCPVQKSSACAQELLVKVTTANDRRPEETPLMYCYQGVAGCPDLDYEQDCICPTCDVWTAYGLKNYKYCRDGSAVQIG